MTTQQQQLYTYLVRLGDSCHVLAHRLCEWCGHAPELEIDIALGNIGLDLLGQTRNFLSYAAEVEGAGRDEDQIAYHRNEREYSNMLLCEQPNGDFAVTIARQLLMDAYNVALYRALSESSDERLSAIAQKGLKEAVYHWRFSRGWLVRLGDGTEESHARMQQGLNEMWRFTDELFRPDELELALAEAGIGVNSADLRDAWDESVNDALAEATLERPEDTVMRQGGRQCTHTENLGYLLAEMQYMQRAYPNNQW